MNTEIFLGAFISKKKINVETGTANEPMNINPGRRLGFSKVLKPIINSTEIATLINNILENSQGFAQLVSISVNAGVLL
jgi:hypothetical protein